MIELQIIIDFNNSALRDSTFSLDERKTEAILRKSSINIILLRVRINVNIVLYF
jgi:hypothetical protein